VEEKWPTSRLPDKYANQDGDIERDYKSHHPFQNEQFRVDTRESVRRHDGTPGCRKVMIG
jgi:hypothetical protein